MCEQFAGWRIRKGASSRGSDAALDRDAGRAGWRSAAVAATAATTVLERRDEIGIMKAIGATNSVVAGIFLAEQVLLALVGGAIGFGAGVGLAWILGQSVFWYTSSLRVVLCQWFWASRNHCDCWQFASLAARAHFQPASILRGE